MIGNIARVFGAVNYKGSLRALDRMFRAAQTQREDFEHWWTDRFNLVMHDPSRHELLRLDSKQVGFEFANSENEETQLEKSVGRVKRLAEDIEVKQFTRMGLVLSVMVDVKMTFDELVPLIARFSLGEREKLAAVTSQKILDVALNFDYGWEGAKGALRCGPMKRKEAVDKVISMGDHGRLFNHPKDDDSLHKFYASIPETSLYFEIDVSKECPAGKNEEGGIPAGEWTLFARKAYEHSVSVFTGIRKLVLEAET